MAVRLSGALMRMVMPREERRASRAPGVASTTLFARARVRGAAAAGAGRGAAAAGAGAGRGAVTGVTSWGGVSDGAAGTALSTRSKRLTEPEGLETAPFVAEPVIAWVTAAGVADGVADSRRAAAPAACGDAIDVPLSVAVAVGDVCHAERIEDPGAKTSRHDPQLENDERQSLLAVDPTVMAVGSEAGE